MLRRVDADAERTVLRTILQDLAQNRLVGETEDIIEVVLRILGVATGVGTSEDCNRPVLPESFAQSIGQLSRLRERTDEHDVDAAGKLLYQVFKPGIADELDVMPLLFAPDSQDLGHDARQVGVHHACKQCSGG